MKPLHLLLLSFVSASAALADIVAPPAPVPLNHADLAHAAAPLLANHTLQALSVGVIQPAGSLTAHLGELSPGLPRPPDDHTRYEIGSITKVFTSLLLAEAVVRGEVQLDTPIARLLPADVTLPDSAGERITLRMLATHTSGLPRIPASLPPDDYTDPYARYTEADLWATLRTVSLDFAPGTKTGYSNLAAGLLGTLLARRAGTSYEALLTARILRPLGLVETTIKLTPDARSHLAPPFDSAGQPASPWAFEALAGAGGLRSTLPDMMRLAHACLHPSDTPLQAALELAWSRQDLAATLSPGGQALGWMIAGDRQTRWHNGQTGGFHAAIFIDRARNVAVVVLANRSSPTVTPLAENLFRRAAGLPEISNANSQRAEVPLHPAQIDRCTGTFRINARFALVCERRHAALFVTPTGQPTDRLAAASPTTFFSRRTPVELVFELPPDENAPATSVELVQGGRRLRAVRDEDTPPPSPSARPEPDSHR